MEFADPNGMSDGGGGENGGNGEAVSEIAAGEVSMCRLLGQASYSHLRRRRIKAHPTKPPLQRDTCA